MAYTTINKSSSFMNPVLFTGNGATNVITGVGFQPDATWIKDRSEAYNPYLFDAVRGVTKELITSSTSAESTAANSLTAWGADGFTLGDNGNINTNTNDMVSWNWKANGSGSANTVGSISSTVSANTTSGFSIVKFTGTGANGTVGHGLGAIPKMIIVKSLGNSRSWVVYNSNIGNTKYLYLDVTNAEATDVTQWNSTTPTSTLFSVGSASESNESGQERTAYCFAEISGYSKFGSYGGNSNTNGTFVYTGFAPSFVMVKQTNATKNWFMFDNKRPGSNVVTKYLEANTWDVEATGTYMDLLSNGFKARQGDGDWNGSGDTYIYMAFGQTLVGTNNTPATAR